MTIVHAFKGSAEQVAIRNHPATTRRALYALEDKVATFTKLVPWPALAASFQADINYLRSTNERGVQPTCTRTSEAPMNNAGLSRA